MENIFLNFFNIIMSIGTRDLTFILLGIFIGILINRKTKVVTRVIKNPVESIMILFIVFVVISQFFTKGPINNKNSFDILNFICNVALAWMMTKYSVKNDYEEKSKELASISYSYSLKCEQNINYGIKICGLAEKDILQCNSSNNCELIQYINRVKDSLLTAKNDIKQNTLNWSFKISTEINQVKKMNSLAVEIKSLEESIQVLNPNDSDYNTQKVSLNSSIRKKQKEINSLSNSMNNDIRLAIENAIINQADVSNIIDESIIKEESNKLFRSAKDKLKPRDAGSSSVDNSPQQDASA